MSKKTTALEVVRTAHRLTAREQQVVQERVLELDTLLEQVAQRDGGVQRTLEGRRGQIARALAGVQTARSAASDCRGRRCSASTTIA